ncbi:MAG: galactokinase [Spirochaetaceae bacterium]|jgi:galactokinase|nr:galactokinase [Spirochaetaceae bacterium]
MTGKELIQNINSESVEGFLGSLYGEEIDAAKKRYRALIEGFINFADRPARGTLGFSVDKPVREFKESGGEVRFFSAPGRTELGGNHTDHNQGKVLAASIQLDAVAAAAKREDGLVIFRSTGYPDVVVDLFRDGGSFNLEVNPAEKGSTEALIRGIAAEFAAQGTKIGGFSANADSTVLAGSGLSSSAAAEVLIAKIFDCLYGDGKRSALDLAKIGQKAENNYFGKPCGLEDQIAGAYGGAVAIDFQNIAEPVVSPVRFDLYALGYALCVVNTGGSHVDLTDDYAAIPAEMKAVAAFLGKKVLRECYKGQVMEKAAEIRKQIGDRAILRALHFFSENNRVADMKESLEKTNSLFDPYERQGALGRYLALVNESGNSSWELLQNIYAPANPTEQGVSLALAVSRAFLGNLGAVRVHGGGFAGTIQAYVPLSSLESYLGEIEPIFGKGTVTVLRIRQTGVTELRV